MNRITVEMLQAGGACPEAIETFEREWPDGAEVTVANALRASELGLSLSWGKKWMSISAWLAYEKATATAWHAYQEAVVTAWRTCGEGFVLAYEEECAIAEHVYEEECAIAWVRGILDSVAAQTKSASAKGAEAPIATGAIH